MIELHLPFPPSVNNLWKSTTKRRGWYRTEKYKNWLRNAGWAVTQQTKQGISGPYEITIQAVRPDRRGRDLDNILKAISDLLKQMRIIEDDRFAEMISMRWVTQGEGVYVRVQRAVVE